MIQPANKPSFTWDDPFYLAQQPTEEERMVGDAGKSLDIARDMHSSNGPILGRAITNTQAFC